MWGWLKSKMGGEQSSPAKTRTGPVAGVVKSQRDDDIPYTSYSITKPIDSGSIKDSPILGVRSKNPTLKEQKERVDLTSSGSMPSTAKQIVVVAQGTSGLPETEPELHQLDSIPIFFPIIRASLNIPSLKEPVESYEKMDYHGILQICVRYKEHLKQCAEAVSFDQNALCIRIKEIDFAIRMLMNMITEKQKKYAKFAEQLHKVNDMSSSIRKSQRILDELIPVLNDLNLMLPPDDQLEEFTIVPSTSIN